MTAGVRDWLPWGAFSDAAVKAALCGPVARWSGRWIARGAVGIGAVRHAPDGAAARQVQVFTGVLAAVELGGPAKRLLLEAALDADFVDAAPGPGDHRVLDAFAARMAQDLVATLDDAFGAAGKSGEGPRVAVALSFSGRDGLAASLPAHVLVPSLKAALGVARRTGPAPGGRAAALAPLRLVAEGVLGHAELALNDLGGLGVGDVVILDRALHEPVELRLSPGGRRIAGGRLGSNGNRVSIQL